LKGQKVKEGDMVKVDIFGKTVEDDPEKEIVFQASNQEDAKKLLSYEESKASQYVPELAIVGEKGFIMDKIDEILPGMKYFEEKVLELDAEDAFGKREGKKIKRISTRKYRKNMNEPPKLGATYKNKKGEQGRVIKIGSGRVFLDFNHPLAGKDVEYRVKVVDKIEDFKDQVRAFIERRMPGPTAEMMELDLDKEEKTLFINIPQNIVFQMAQQQGGIYFKMGLAYDLQEFMDDVDVVKFVETYEKPESHDHDHDHDDEHVDVEEAEEQIEIDESEEDSE